MEQSKNSYNKEIKNDCKKLKYVIFKKQKLNIAIGQAIICPNKRKRKI